MCRHELNQLVGTADGVLCRACGKLFPTFSELERDREPEKNAPEPERPKRVRKKKEAAE